MIIALPKGGVLARSLGIIASFIGRDPDPKQLQHVADGVTFLLAKHRDIPLLIQRNLIDVGITSTDWLAERRCVAPVLARLDWCDSRISVVGAPGTDVSKIRKLRCATEYPVLASDYFARTGVTDLDMLCISGSSEAYVGSLCDVALDCVETGETLRRNGLAELGVVKMSSIVAVASNRGSEVAARALELFAERRVT